MFDILTLNILKIDLIILFCFIKHIISIRFLTIYIIALSSFMRSSLRILISIWVLRFLIIVILPSRFPFIQFLFFIFFFILFNLVLVHFNIITSILSRNIRISRLFSPMMKSRLLLNWLFLIFKLLLRLIIKIHLLIVGWSFRFFVAWHEIIRFSITIVVFDLTCYFCVIDAFEILFYCLFTVFCV